MNNCSTNDIGHVNVMLVFRCCLFGLFAWSALLQAEQVADESVIVIKNFEETIWFDVLESNLHDDLLLLSDRNSRMRVLFNGKLIVKVKPGVDIGRVLSRHEGKVTAKLLGDTMVGNIYLLEFTASASLTVSKRFQYVKNAMHQLAADSSVIYVQPDLAPLRGKRRHRSSDEPQLDRITLFDEQQFIPKVTEGYDNGTVRIAVIDNGFDFSLPQLRNANVVFQYDADRLVTDARPVDPVESHGSEVLKVILAAAQTDVSEIEVVAIRQVNTWTSGMMLGIQVASKMNADILNVSWLIPWLAEPVFDLLSSAYASPERHRYLVIAAGNGNKDSCQTNQLARYFEGYASVIVVGAANKAQQKLASSNFGDCVDVYANGVISEGLVDNLAIAINSTSMAAAFVSGSLAKVIKKSNIK